VVVEEQNTDLRGKSFHPSWFNYISQFFFALIFFAAAVVMHLKEIKLWPIVAAVLGVVILIRVFFTRLSFTYTVTKDCVRSRNGLIARDESEIRITDIREVGVTQNIGQRIFGIGSVYFASAGTGDVEVTFDGVSDPHEVREYVNKIRSSPKAYDKKRCQQCGEFIWIKAKVCPHCSYQFGDE
jgi:uncharacterized membrane protein YdbT with pleckstrin-like domain